MSFTIIFLLSIFLMIGLTVIIYSIVKRIFRVLEERLSRVRPVSLKTEEKPKGRFILALNMLLVLFIGLEGITSSLVDTIFNPDFVASEIKKLDLADAATELWSRQSSEQLTGEVAGLFSEQIYAAESMEATMSQLGPSVTDRLTEAVYTGFEYLTGNEQDLDVAIPLEDLQETLKQNLREIVAQSPPAELKNATSEQLWAYCEAVYEQEFEKVPQVVHLSSTSSSPDVIYRLNEFRTAVSYFSYVPVLFLSLIVLMSALIILVRRNFKAALWELGIIFVVSGLIDFLYAYIAQQAGTHAGLLSFVPSINVWLVQVVADVVVVARQPVMLLTGIGAGLLIVSFLIPQIKSHVAAPVSPTGD
jgi:hypothetical protein